MGYDILCIFTLSPSIINFCFEIQKFVNQAIEMYLKDKRAEAKIEASDKGFVATGQHTPKYTFTKDDRDEFFAEKNTSSYISRVCIDCLLRDSAGDNLDITLEHCKIT